MSSGKSQATLHKSRPFDETDAQRCFARLAVAFGPQRIEDPAQRKLLAREWIEALGGLEAHVVNSAMGAVIRKSKFWPTISEVLEACQPFDYRTTEERFGAKHRDVTREWLTAPGFARGGRTVAEELVHRSSIVATAKVDRAYTQEPRIAGGRPVHEWAPASQDPPTIHVKQSCAARRARGEPTCRHDCSGIPEFCQDYAAARGYVPRQDAAE